MTATGLFRITFVASGRDTQSSAFLSAPGIDELYSCYQFASAPSKSIVACVPSQKGLLDDPPQRHIAMGSGCSMTRPSTSVSVAGPERCTGRFR